MNRRSLLTLLLATAATPAMAVGHRPLKGRALPQGIEVATAQMKSAFSGLFTGFSDATVFDTTTTVTDAAGLQTALTACFAAPTSTSITKKFRINCNWDGISTTGANTSAVTSPGFAGRTDGHFDNGGGIYVVASPGKTPAIGNRVTIRSTRGIQFKGVGFANKWFGVSGTAETTYCLEGTATGSFPARGVFVIEDALIGPGYWYPADPISVYCGAYNTSGRAVDQLYFKNCKLAGHENAIKGHCLLGKLENVDIQLVKQDFSNWFQFTDALDTGVTSYVWLSACSIRNPVDGLANANNHMDGGQTGRDGDVNLGYRVLWEDVVLHANHSYAGAPGVGGGTQGSYNDDLLTANNQFVIRRCIILTASPNSFAYWCPVPTAISYIDSCTFSRCGMVPSNLPSDPYAAQDFSMGIGGGGGTDAQRIAGTGPFAGGLKWLIATNMIQGIVSTESWMNQGAYVECDPRNTSTVTNVAQRPENIFMGNGVGFQRGVYIAGKLSYQLPGETGAGVSSRTRAQFAQDVWDLFEPLPAYTGWGAPTPVGVIV